MYRDEEAIISSCDLPPDVCYREVIAPHKGELELWYQAHRSLSVDFAILVLTVLAVFFPGTQDCVYRVFNGLPQPHRASNAASPSDC